MGRGTLTFPLTDAANEPVKGKVNVDLTPQSGSAGGRPMSARDIDLGGDKQLNITEIECLGGPGTLYRVAVDAVNFKTYSFFQIMVADHENEAPDGQIRLVVNPGKINNISAPDFGGLPSKLQAFLENASPIMLEEGDKDLVGRNGEDLYGALGPLRKACLLNLFTKATHPTSSRIFEFLKDQTLLLMRQDRFFATIDPAVEEFLTKDNQFKSAPKILHKPLKDFERRGSFKSKDAHANIQLTLMRNSKDGSMAADIDIDESSGLEHGFEVIGNIFKGRTNPYLVRDLLLLADADEMTLDPRYRFVFK